MFKRWCALIPEVRAAAKMTSLGCSGRALVPSVSTSFRFLLVSDAVFRFLLDS